jgi:hypothetical protein
MSLSSPFSTQDRSLQSLRERLKGKKQDPGPRIQPPSPEASVLRNL